MSGSAKIACFIGCALMASTPAFSADIASQPLYKAGPMPVQTWTGFHVGANVGYGIGRNPSTAGLPGFFGNSVPPEDLHTGSKRRPRRFAGRLRRPIRRMVFGIEGDWQWSAQKTNSCVFFCDAEGAITATQRLSSFGTLRGRLGIASGASLLYATGGLAVANIGTDLRYDRSLKGLTDAASFRHSPVGWTAGAGMKPSSAATGQQKSNISTRISARPLTASMLPTLSSRR